MYGVQLDPSGNYLLLGGSGDEYKYSRCRDDGWCSDHWVSYLVVLDKWVSNSSYVNFFLYSASWLYGPRFCCPTKIDLAIGITLIF